MTGDATVGAAAERLHAVTARLRVECPWDREQTHGSLAPYALEEAAELADALRAADAAAAADPASPAHAEAVDDLVGELGDVLLQVFLNAAVGEQAGTFSTADVFAAVEAKMIRRHPHVFERPPGAPEPTDDELAEQWERIKRAEREQRAERGRRRAEAEPSP